MSYDNFFFQTVYVYLVFGKLVAKELFAFCKNSKASANVVFFDDSGKAEYDC